MLALNNARGVLQKTRSWNRGSVHHLLAVSFRGGLQRKLSSQPPKLSRRSRRDLLILSLSTVCSVAYLLTVEDWDEGVRNAKCLLLKARHQGPNENHTNSFLPPPVQRYIDVAVKDCQQDEEKPPTSILQTRHCGEFYALGQWYQFRGLFLASTPIPGFLWEAELNVFGIPHRVLETYFENEGGNIVTKAWGKIPLVQVVEEDPYILFWLAMLPLFPVSFFSSSNYFTWCACSDLYRCKAHLLDASTNVNFEVEWFFREEDHLLERIEVRAPPNSQDFLPKVWKAVYKEYKPLKDHGLLVPSRMEIGRGEGDEWTPHLKIRPDSLKQSS